VKSGRPLPWVLFSAAMLLTIVCFVVGWRVKAMEPPAAPIAASAMPNADIRDLTNLLDRYDQTAKQGRLVLQRRDVDPSIASDPTWQADSVQVVAELKREYDEALTIPQPPNNVGIQPCVSEGLRLSYEGYQMLNDGFQAGGHHAYYLGSHGNWDFNLGSQRLLECRGQLLAKAAAG